MFRACFVMIFIVKLPRYGTDNNPPLAVHTSEILNVLAIHNSDNTFHHRCYDSDISPTMVKSFFGEP